VTQGVRPPVWGIGLGIAVAAGSAVFAVTDEWVVIYMSLMLGDVDIHRRLGLGDFGVAGVVHVIALVVMIMLTFVVLAVPVRARKAMACAAAAAGLAALVSLGYALHVGYQAADVAVRGTADVWRMAEKMDMDFVQLVSIEGAVHVSAASVCLAGWGSAMAAWGRRAGPLAAVIAAGVLTALTWVTPWTGAWLMTKDSVSFELSWLWNDPAAGLVYVAASAALVGLGLVAVTWPRFWLSALMVIAAGTCLGLTLWYARNSFKGAKGHALRTIGAEGPNGTILVFAAVIIVAAAFCAANRRRLARRTSQVALVGVA
jgi:hypothetical protein